MDSPTPKFVPLILLGSLLFVAFFSSGCGLANVGSFGSASGTSGRTLVTPSNLTPDTQVQPNFQPQPAWQSNGQYANTPDGRQVVLHGGTWDFTTNQPFSGVIYTKDSYGRCVKLYPNKVWEPCCLSGSGPCCGNSEAGCRRNSTRVKLTTRPTPVSNPVSQHDERPELKRSTPLPPAPPPPPAFIVFYQLDGGFGRATVFMDGMPIAHLREKRYFVMRVPGNKTHLFSIAKLQQGRQPLNLEPGRDYFLKNTERGCPGGKECVQSVGQAGYQRDLANHDIRLLQTKDVLNASIIVEPDLSGSLRE